MTVSDSKLYELLSSKPGKEEAKYLVEFVEEKVDEKSHLLATKEDLATLKTGLITEINGTRVDLIKWMVATSIALVSLVIAGIKLL